VVVGARAIPDGHQDIGGGRYGGLVEQGIRPLFLNRFARQAQKVILRCFKQNGRKVFSNYPNDMGKIPPAPAILRRRCGNEGFLKRASRGHAKTIDPNPEGGHPPPAFSFYTPRG